MRIQPIDLVGSLEGGAVKIPKLTEQEEVLSVSAYRRDECSGHSYGDPVVDLRDCLRDGLCLIDLPAGVWRVYEVDNSRLHKTGLITQGEQIAQLKI